VISNNKREAFILLKTLVLLLLHENDEFEKAEDTRLDTIRTLPVIKN